MSSQNPEPNDALRRAVHVAGGQSALGRLCGVSQAAVWKWLNKARLLPAEHVLTVERETGISRQELRPDLYPQETPPLPPAPVTGGVAVEAPGVVCNRGATTHREGANDA